MSTESEASYAVDAVNRVKRRPDRGFYDHDTVHALLDAAALCHVSYVVDGQPFCTPTLFWREGSRLYWHGSNSSRMLRNLSEGEPAARYCHPREEHLLPLHVCVGMADKIGRLIFDDYILGKRSIAFLW
jgi:hypothetical protein